MSNNLITVEQICLNHNIEAAFINTLESYGLVEIVVMNELPHLEADSLIIVERFIRLHYDLEINFEGIDVIVNLLQQIESLQKQLAESQNRLRLFDRV